MSAGGGAVRRVGVMGVGALGLPIVRRLAGRGFPVSVYDADRERLREAAAVPVRVAGSCRDLAQQVDCLVVLVGGRDSLERVFWGEDGALGGLRAGQLVVLHSTVGPQAALRLAEACTKAGVAMIDAPVNGVPEVAAEGKLVVLAGGSASDVARGQEVWQCYAHRTFHTGPVGSGQVAKLVNNALLYTSVAAYAQLAEFMQSFGADTGIVREAVLASSGACWAVENWDLIRRLRRYHARKDFSLLIQEARARGLDTGLFEAAKERTPDFLRELEEEEEVGTR